MLSRINENLYKYYYLTWVMLLLLFKRSIPKWMVEKIKKDLLPPVAIGEVERLVK